MEVALEQHHIQLLLIKSLKIEDLLLWICACKTNLSIWSDTKLLRELCKKWKIDMSCESIRHLHYIYSKLYFTSITPLVIKDKTLWKLLIRRSRREDRLSEDAAKLLMSTMEKGMPIISSTEFTYVGKHKDNISKCIEKNEIDRVFTLIQEDPYSIFNLSSYIYTAVKYNKHDILLRLFDDTVGYSSRAIRRYICYADEYTLRIILATWNKFKVQCGDVLTSMVEEMIIYNKHRHFEILLRFMISRYYETWKLIIKWLFMSMDNLSIECVRVIFKICGEKAPIYKSIYSYCLSKINVERLERCRKYTKSILEYYK